MANLQGKPWHSLKALRTPSCAWWLAWVLSSATAPAAVPVLLSTANEIRCYEKIEFLIELSTAYTNSFDPGEVELNVQFTTPGSEPSTVPAFYYQHYERKQVGMRGQQRDWLYPVGQPHWRARFAPIKPGRYEAVAILSDWSGTARSAPLYFDTARSTREGFLRVSEKDPRFLEFSQGQPFFAVGQNLAFIGSQQYVTLSRAEQIFQKLAENGANYLRIWTCCEDWAMAIEARKSAWGRSWSWNPPLASLPAAMNEAVDSRTNALKFLTLTESRRSLKVEPSHPVALRPSTRYTFVGRLRIDEGSTVAVEVHNSGATAPIAGRSATGWTPFRHEFRTGPEDYWLSQTSFRLEGNGTAQVDQVSLRESAGGPELLWEADIHRPTRGYYNQPDCFMLDQLLRAAETNHLYLQLCLLTRDLYMDRLKDAGSAEYRRAVQAAKSTFRYAIARWGYSTSLAAWEYWNEMNPGLPTDRFYVELGDYFEQTDPYRHLRRTSTWGPSPKDCQHLKLDVADVHFYLRPADKGRIDDEVHAVMERTQWLRGQAPNKPIQLGEFGLADDKWAITEEMKRSAEVVDAHSALWASALSGAAGTAMFWWWERLDQRNFYPHYKPLSQFIADVPWNSGQVQPAAVSRTSDGVRVLGLKARDRAWLWVYNRESAWANLVSAGRMPSSVTNALIELPGLPAGRYQLRWSDTRDGKVLREESLTVQDNTLRLTVPPFTHDIACRVTP